MSLRVSLLNPQLVNKKAQSHKFASSYNNPKSQVESFKLLQDHTGYGSANSISIIDFDKALIARIDKFYGAIRLNNAKQYNANIYNESINKAVYSNKNTELLNSSKIKIQKEELTLNNLFSFLHQNMPAKSMGVNDAFNVITRMHLYTILLSQDHINVDYEKTQYILKRAQIELNRIIDTYCDGLDNEPFIDIFEKLRKDSFGDILNKLQKK